MIKDLNIVLDLETLDIASTAAILQIGAVVVGRDNDEFLAHIDIHNIITVPGLTRDRLTEEWWAQQPNWDELKQGVYTYKGALRAFSKWLAQMHEKYDLPPRNIWGRGVDFDNAILAHSYKICGLELPWDFRRNRDLRTFEAMFPVLSLRASDVAAKRKWKEFERRADEQPHTALGDARFDARMLEEVLDSQQYKIGTTYASRNLARSIHTTTAGDELPSSSPSSDIPNPSETIHDGESGIDLS